MNDLTSTFDKALAEINDSLTQDLRKKATSAGWPVSVVRTLRVDVRKDEPVRVTSAAQDLEYGTESQAPSPVIRKFIEVEIPKVFETILDDSFPLGEVV